jgi:hypothetical protein
MFLLHLSNAFLISRNNERMAFPARPWRVVRCSTIPRPSPNLLNTLIKWDCSIEAFKVTELLQIVQVAELSRTDALYSHDMSLKCFAHFD